MLTQLQNQIERVFLGKRETVQLCLTAFLAGEHILLEDVPGVGKTLLARTLARCVDGQFRRIQFTPDLLPAEITGSTIPAAFEMFRNETSRNVSADSLSVSRGVLGDGEFRDGAAAGMRNAEFRDGTAAGMRNAEFRDGAAAGMRNAEFRDGTAAGMAGTSPWKFVPGPIFANIVLADEINRAAPRTQSALLEAMGEGCVTTEGETRPLPDPFFVIATQNPAGFEGTFPLPESQLDRFLMRIPIGYAPREREKLLLSRRREPESALSPVLTLSDVRTLREEVQNVHVEDTIADYMMDIVSQTRQDPGCRVGVSTRGLQAFYRAVQAWSKIQGRDYAIPDDVKFLAVPVLAHRILLRSSFRQETRMESEAFVRKILERVLAP
ncbi:MAG: MoxR family ATPase [Thermoguttaceae bacterium]|nr:MoxR family ATPase [Thermoguttaceae bacterium]